MHLTPDSKFTEKLPLHQMPHEGTIGNEERLLVKKNGCLRQFIQIDNSVPKNLQGSAYVFQAWKTYDVPNEVISLF